MTSSTTIVKGQVKGLLKGLRYISQIFDEEEEKEMQIGFPTDVKHLAHIGCDDTATKAPSWMTEFKETDQPPPSGAVNSADKTSKKEGRRHGSGDSSEPPRIPRRHYQKSEEEKSSSGGTKHRRKSKTTSSMSEEKDGSKKSSRNRRASKEGSLPEIYLSDQEK